VASATTTDSATPAAAAPVQTISLDALVDAATAS
jgi:hypothetical protein